MTDQMKLAHMDIYAEGPLYKRPQTKMRSLGAAIFLVAIEDYRSTDEQELQDRGTISLPANAPVAGAP